MRFALAMILFPLVLCSSAQALEPTDTMASWRTASPAEKVRIVTAIVKKTDQKYAVKTIVACVDEAAGVPGHAALPVSQIVMACMSSDAGEPV